MLHRCGVFVTPRGGVLKCVSVVLAIINNYGKTTEAVRKIILPHVLM